MSDNANLLTLMYKFRHGVDSDDFGDVQDAVERIIDAVFDGRQIMVEWKELRNRLGTDPGFFRLMSENPSGDDIGKYVINLHDELLWNGRPSGKSVFARLREKKEKGIPLRPTRRFSIAVTGHRPDKMFGYDLHDGRWIMLGKIMRQWLKRKLVEKGPLDCISGMALGVDQLYALVALKLRDEGHDIRVISALPCRNQNARWVSDEYWQEIMARADEAVYVHDGPYTPSCMKDRNIWMLQHSDLLLAVWNGTGGGTSHCVNHALRSGVEYENIWEQLQEALQREEPVRTPGM